MKSIKTDATSALPDSKRLIDIYILKSNKISPKVTVSINVAHIRLSNAPHATSQNSRHNDDHTVIFSVPEPALTAYSLAGFFQMHCREYRCSQLKKKMSEKVDSRNYDHICNHLERNPGFNEINFC